MLFFGGLSLALRSHDQILAFTTLSVIMASILWKWKEMYIITMIRSGPSRCCPSRWHQYSENEKKCTSLRWSDPVLHDAVRHDGISTLKMKRNVHCYDDQIPAFTTLSIPMVSVLWKWKEMYIIRTGNPPHHFFTRIKNKIIITPPKKNGGSHPLFFRQQFFVLFFSR